MADLNETRVTPSRDPSAQRPQVDPRTGQPAIVALWRERFD